MALEDQLTGEQRDAAEALIQLFEQYGLGSLAPKIVEYIRQGYSSSTISLLLQETDEYEQRFIGNKIRRQNGYSVLSPAEYLAVENAYRAIMQSAGLPPGFYDSPADFAEFIGQNKSPQEINERVQAAVQFVQTRDPALKAAAQRYLGISEGQMAAFFLDPDRAEPDIQRTIQSVGIGAEAVRAGFDEFGRIAAERLADLGVDQGQARAGFSSIARTLPTLDALSKIHGETQFTLEEAVAQTFEGDAEATRKRKRLASRERAAFSGSGGQSRGSLSRSSSYSY